MPHAGSVDGLIRTAKSFIRYHCVLSVGGSCLEAFVVGTEVLEMRSGPVQGVISM